MKNNNDDYRDAGRAPNIANGDIWKIKEDPSIFIDAFAIDKKHQGGLIFASCYGRDMPLHHLTAMLTLPITEGGLRKLTLVDVKTGEEIEAPIVDAERLSKTTGRMTDSIFAGLVNMWLYQGDLCNPTFNSQIAWLIAQKTGDDMDPDDVDYDARGFLRGDAKRKDAVWRSIKTISTVPLFEEWRDPILKSLFDWGEKEVAESA